MSETWGDREEGDDVTAPTVDGGDTQDTERGDDEAHQVGEVGGSPIKQEDRLEEDAKESIPLEALESGEDDAAIEAAMKEKDREEEEGGEGEDCLLQDSNPATSKTQGELGEEEVADEEIGEVINSEAGSSNGSRSDASGSEDNQEEEEDSPEDHSRPPGYPPPPMGYGHPYPPPPPGYYPYPPSPYPPHPHYGYPPPPPGYYPYYPPPGHPHQMPPPHHGHPAGERDPNTGQFIYGGPPPSLSVPQKRSRMRTKTPQDIQNRKIRKNAQSRHRAARLREKVENIKVKSQEMMNEDEAQLYGTVEERRARKNNRSRERALEKKAELERILSMPGEQRSTEEKKTLLVAITAKKRKNEGDRLRREKLKKMGLKQKPSNMTIQSRPRKPLSGDNIMPYGSAPPGMPGIPNGMPPPHHLGPPQMVPPGMPPPPGVPHDGLAEGYQHPPPPQPHPFAYPPPNPYYTDPPHMKDDEEHDSNDGEGSDLDDRPGSANTAEEVSELLLQDDAGETDVHVYIKEDVTQI